MTQLKFGLVTREACGFEKRNRWKEEVANWDLGLGESHVLSWVYSNPGYEAILDDRAAKNAAALRLVNE